MRALEQNEIMVPSSDADVAQLAVIEALRSQGDAMREQSKVLGKMADRFDDIGEAIHTIDKRLTVIEANTLERDVRANREDIDLLDLRLTAVEKAMIRNGEDRMTVVERDLHLREGMGAAMRAVKDYGPFIATIIAAMFVLLVVSGRIAL